MKSMHRIVVFIACSIILLSFFSSNLMIYIAADNVKQTERKVYSGATIEDQFADDRIMVVLNNEASLDYLQTGKIEFSELKHANIKHYTDTRGKQIKTMLEEKESISLAARMFTSNPNVEEISNYREVMCIELQDHSKEKVLEAISLLEQRDEVYYVGPDYKIELYSSNNSVPLQNGVWAPETIGLQKALNMIENPQTVLVGVLDSGIDANHPDLTNKVNADLSKNCVYYNSGNTNENTASPLEDKYGHGTHVAGIIGAAANENKGTMGVCPNVQFVSLRVFDANGGCYSSFVADALEHVYDKWSEGSMIRILNFSGGFSEQKVESGIYDESLKELINSYPGLFICGAGNDLELVKSENTDSNMGVSYYPASYHFSYDDRMIVVGASNMADNGLWIDSSDTGSNYGRKAVDIFAPGDTILSCHPTSLCGESSCGTYHESLGYHYDSGTSMATPYVTGVAALILSVHPDLTASEVKNLILDNVTDVIHEDTGMYVFHGLCTSGGRLNAYLALYASHSFGAWQQNATIGCRYRQCAECGYKDIEEHSFENTYVNDCVFSECTECGYYREEHTQAYVYVQNDSLTHNRRYPCCNHTIAESHRGAWINLDATYHTRICTDCGYTQYQTHEECWNDFKNMCMACKRTGPISGGIMRIPPQEETAE